MNSLQKNNGRPELENIWENRSSKTREICSTGIFMREVYTSTAQEELVLKLLTVVTHEIKKSSNINVRQ